MKPGFKRTEIGAIPMDWEVRRVRDLCRPVRGGSPRPAGDPRFFGGTFIPWLTVAALTTIPSSQLIVTDTNECLTKEGAALSRRLEAGTVIIANSGATLGVAKILGIECCANDGVAALLSLGDSACPRYLVYLLNSMTEWLRSVVATGNGQPNLNTRLIGDLALALPPTITEQQRIAAAFSSLDELIESLEHLLAKKRAIKQGAMQSLLTGAKRLPGFTEPWRSMSFGDLARPRRDRIDPRTDGTIGFCIELEHLQPGTGCLLGATSTHAGASLKSAFRPGDVLFGKLRAYLRKYWLADRHGYCSTEIWVLAPSTDVVSQEFLFQLVTTDRFIEAASAAYGTHMPRSDWRFVSGLQVLMPALREQAAIAEVLTDLGADIDATTAKLQKARAVMQGMMQELLTGRIRLV